MSNQIKQSSKVQELMQKMQDKQKILMDLEDKLYHCEAELLKNKAFMLACKDTPKIDVKKKDKIIKCLDETEKELEELRNLIIKQDELKKVSPAEFEEVFEQTKIQMNIRKNDLKKKIKDLKNKIEYCENEPKRNIECLNATNECLEKKIYVLKNELCAVKHDIFQIEMRMDNDK